MPRTRRPPVNAEADVVRACLLYLGLKGIPAWRNNTGAMRATYKGRERFIRYGVPGAPDILGVWNAPGPHRGKLLAVECKGPDGRLSEAQRAFLANIQSAGGVALVVRSLDDLIRGLAALEARP